MSKATKEGVMLYTSDTQEVLSISSHASYGELIDGKSHRLKRGFFDVKIFCFKTLRKYLKNEFLNIFEIVI